MKDSFFLATQHALSNITKTFDTVWPTAAGLWNLRCIVNGVKAEFPDITEAQLAAKFTLGSGLHGVNFKRSFFERDWNAQQEDFAWILLNSTIPIFEGWIEELKQTVFGDIKVKELQFPDTVQSEVARLTASQSTALTGAFYSLYSGMRYRSYSNIQNLLYCYRIFKEARNCYMHNGAIADSKLVMAFNNYLPFATTSDLDVKEVPEFTAPVINQPIALSLRGVVGFSHILIKIIASLDAELLRSTSAENEFLTRFQTVHPIRRTIKADPQSAKNQVARYINQCGYARPVVSDELIALLLSHNLINR